VQYLEPRRIEELELLDLGKVAELAFTDYLALFFDDLDIPS
jgi:hypothetical protein